MVKRDSPSTRARGLLSHPDLDARATGQVRAVSWIGDENTVYARLGEASPCSEATLVDPDDLPAGRRALPGDPEKSIRDYRTATDHPPVHPHDLSRLSKTWCHDRDTGREPCRRRRRSGRNRAQEKKDASDRDRNAEPHEATLNDLASSVKPRKQLRRLGVSVNALRLPEPMLSHPGRLPSGSGSQELASALSDGKRD
jgi:hypothetical protein